MPWNPHAWERVRQEYLFPPEEKRPSEPVATKGAQEFGALMNHSVQSLQRFLMGG